MQLRDALADAGSTTEREKFDEILSDDGFYKALEDTSVTGDDQPVSTSCRSSAASTPPARRCATAAA